MRIIEDDFSGTEITALLAEHLDGMARHSPQESMHALDLAGLQEPDITFWTAWDDSELLGCGALKELDDSHGEIKSMRTANAHLGQGVATAILSHLINEAKRRSYSRLSLETGSGPAFDAAYSLYQKFGFDYCGPFGDYRDDPFSRFMTLKL
ncbi:MAG: GNAT family N-acetyltransferase [Gammaproteobacteria bacterium]|nr:GNAT family N-acetyltransferase [Gammaproteobacteria bacterium]